MQACGSDRDISIQKDLSSFITRVLEVVCKETDEDIYMCVIYLITSQCPCHIVSNPMGRKGTRHPVHSFKEHSGPGVGVKAAFPAMLFTMKAKSLLTTCAIFKIKNTREPLGKNTKQENHLSLFKNRDTFPAPAESEAGGRRNTGWPKDSRDTDGLGPVSTQLESEQITEAWNPRKCVPLPGHWSALMGIPEPGPFPSLSLSPF